MLMFELEVWGIKIYVYMIPQNLSTVLKMTEIQNYNNFSEHIQLLHGTCYRAQTSSCLSLPPVDRG